MKCNKTYLPLALTAMATLFLANTAIGKDKPAVTVFVTNYLQRGSTSTEPTPEQLTDKLSVFAAPGEYEPVTISIRAGIELKGLQVMLTGVLKNQAGDTIPTSAVDIRLVDPLESWSKRQEECYLLPKTAVDVPAETTRRFWITVKVPADAKPGLYRSRILIGKTITELGPDLGRLDTIKELAYEVNVLPVKLLSAKDTGMAFFMYNNTVYYHYFSPGLVNEEYQRKVFEDMREHGMTTATVYLSPVVDGKFTLTESDEKHLSFSQTMKLLKQTDLVTPGLPVLWIGAENYVHPTEQKVWEGVLDAAEKNKWPEIVFYLFDEPKSETEYLRGAMSRVAEFGAKYPQYDLRITTAMGSSPGIHEVGHYYDLWVGHVLLALGGVGGEWAKEKNWDTDMMSEAERLKKELWVYDCTLSPVDAETSRYYFGIWAWVTGVKGCAHWSYFDNGPLLSYIYPDKEELVPTIGWEAVREGIDDYRYLSTLKRLAEKAKSTGKADLAKGAEKIFEEVKKMVTMGNYSKAYCQADKSGVKDARHYDRPRPEPDMAIEAYDQMRLKVAKEIEKIATALDD
jgi:hypothetical protein